VPPDFPDGTRSLELRRTVGVRLEPGDDGKRIGTVAVDTRVAWVRTAKTKAATGLIEIRPRGWICGTTSSRARSRRTARRSAPGARRVVPGVYGKVTAPAAVTYIAREAQAGPEAGQARQEAAGKTAKGRQVGRQARQAGRKPRAAAAMSASARRPDDRPTSPT